MLRKRPATKIRFKTIAPFLQTGENRTSRILSYVGLGVGVLLLFCCVQMFINVNNLLKDRAVNTTGGFDYISVTKAITNETMGKDNRFTKREVNEIRSQSFIADVAPLISNQFRVKASAGSMLPFSTDLFLESIKTDFIDSVPPTFSWQPGQAEVPIIFSADFLEMYNVFAPAQGLPQLSSSSISSINIVLECYGATGMQTFSGRIVAVSDRINSVLVPETFLLWANKAFGNISTIPASRVYLKTTDANSVELLNFLEEKNYHINKDKTKFGRVKQILQSIVSGLGIFAILVILLAMMLFSFYLQLMIARSKENLQLLFTLGYSPDWLSATVSKKWIPVYFVIISMSIAAIILLQFLFTTYVFNNRPQLSLYPSMYVYLIAVILLLLCVLVNYRLIRKSLFKL